MSPDLDVAVVGAGIAGLTTAHELQRAGLAVRVFEADDAVGGRMRSLRQDGWILDTGAEQISTRGYRATWELLGRLGVPGHAAPRLGGPIGVWRDGRAHPGVAGTTAPLTGAGLGPRARLDLARLLARLSARRRAFDPDRPEATPVGDATVREFAAGCHPDLHDYLLQPVTGSFFGWDTARSAAAPLLSLLQEVGPVSGWRTYSGGMDLLARRLADGLDVECGVPVREVAAEDEGVRLRLGRSEGGERGGDGGGGERCVTARAAVLAVPAPVAARMHPGAPADERPFLTACTFTPMLKVGCLLERPLAPVSRTPLYALLTPRAEDDTLSAILVDHLKHPDRAPAGKGLMTLIADARTVPELLGAPEQFVIDRLVGAAVRYVPGLADDPGARVVVSFAHGLPEATPEALRQRARFAARPARPVEYAGDWVMLRPASEGAVRAGALAASRVRSRLRPPRRPVARGALSSARSGRPAPSGHSKENAA
jgi:oxygen-dependent protoporphyrinogen oxidase